MAYSDALKAEALILLQSTGYPHTAGGLEMTAKQVGVHPDTLKNWHGGKHIDERAVQEISAYKRDEVVSKLGRLQHILIDELEKRVIDGGGTAKDVAVALGIVSDKIQLLRGEATQNVDTRIVIERRGVGFGDAVTPGALPEAVNVAASFPPVGAAVGVEAQWMDGDGDGDGDDGRDGQG